VLSLVLGSLLLTCRLKNKKKQALIENSPLSRERNISVSCTAIYNASLSALLSNIEEKRRNRIK
jgi:hypothetical protein